MGAKPLAVLDVIVVGKTNKRRHQQNYYCD